MSAIHVKYPRDEKYILEYLSEHSRWKNQSEGSIEIFPIKISRN